MINLTPSIMKLENLSAVTRKNAQNTPYMMRDIADFLEHTLPKLIDELYAQQSIADREREEDIEWGQMNLNHELDKAVGM